MRLVPDARIALQRKIAWLLFFSFFSFCFAGWLIYFNKKNIESTTFWIEHTYSVMQQVERMRANLNNRDLRTDQPAVFYNRLDAGLAGLARSTRDNPIQQRRTDSLSGMLVRLKEGDDNRGTVSSIEGVLAGMIQEETNLLTKRQLAHEQMDAKITGLVIGGGALVFFFVFIVLLRLNRDIELRKKAEDKLRENQSSLIAATTDAQKAKEMQELFLANMSHEIRTPMNGIQGMTDLLLDTALTDQQKEFALIIKRSAGNLLVIINDILDFSKIKAGKLAIETIDFRLREVLDNVKAIFDHRVKMKGILLEITADPAVPDRLRGDPYRLNQVLLNLTGNAVKFTERGSVSLHVRMEDRHVGLDDRSASGVTLSFSVSDTGIGISESSLPYIFDHFSQGGMDISRRYGGTGLGLAISHQLVQLQGGEIRVKSVEGVGTNFCFRLTYAISTTSAEAGGSGSPAAVLTDYSRCLAGRRFLVAEDNEVNQQLVDQVLRRGGGLVQLAGNGAEAVRFLQQGERYDLIIMDLQMPVMDGYAATACIRADLGLQTPIIAMTATALIGEQLRCFEVGMNDYMTKPFEFTELYRRIIGLLPVGRPLYADPNLRKVQ